MSEYTLVEKPFLDQLKTLGWTVIDQAIGQHTEIPTNPARSLRSSFREVGLKEVFVTSVRALNLTPDGHPWLTDAQLDELYDNLLRRPGRGNLVEINEAVQKLLFRAQVDVNEVTGEQYPNVTLIDFHDPTRNAFHAINQFRINTPGRGRDFIIPDIVLFVNGLPLAVVECKRPGPTDANPMADAFEQLMRYSDQRPASHAAGYHEGEPRLFFTNQLLIRTTGDRAEYGSITATEEEFFKPWRSYFDEEQGAFVTLPSETEPSQDVLIRGMLTKPVLLDMMRTCTVFTDANKKRVKIVARHQQYRAMRKIIDRLQTKDTPEERTGAIWHTQGSGKSLTMVFVVRKLRMMDDLRDYKVCLVCDRIDLEEQLEKTAALTGERVTRIESSGMMRERLATDTSNLNMVMVHKFLGGSDESLPGYVPKEVRDKRFQQIGEVNPSPRILLMIDEAHRSQGSELGDNLVEAFPHATRLAFTGTPLIVTKDESQRTVKRFGDYIDTYALLDAVDDGTTVRILYEGKTADAAVDHKHEFDRDFDETIREHVEGQLRKDANRAQLRAMAERQQKPFEDLVKERTDAEILALKKKWGTTGDLLEADARIKEIARDLVNHYIDEILPNGFKAQVVVSSQMAAVKYRKYIDQALEKRLALERAKPALDVDPAELTDKELAEYRDDERIGRIEFLKAVVVISGMGTNEPGAITTERKRASQLNAVDNFKEPFDPEKPHTGVAFLIVCDMLLTGFDAPIEQVMYVDKKIKHHNLLQTIARVNRVAKGKNRGFIVDYIGLANHLKEALSIYARDDAELIEAGLGDVAEEIPILETRYKRLLTLFDERGVERIREWVEQKTRPSEDPAIMELAVQALEDLKTRAEFEVRFKLFLTSLDVVLPKPPANPFKIPAKRFGVILDEARRRYKDETLSISSVGGKVKKLIDDHLISLGINPKVPPVELLSETFIKELDRHTSSRAKASEMEHAIRKHAKVHFNEDPEFYKSISERLEAAIKHHKDDWDKLVGELFSVREDAEAGRRDAVEGVSPKATPFYANLCHEVYDGEDVPDETSDTLKQMTSRIVDELVEHMDIVNFWNNPDQQRKVRAALKDELIGSNIPEVMAKHAQLADAMIALAKERQQDLMS